MRIVQDFNATPIEEGLEITSAIYAGDYVIILKFNNEEERSIDFGPFLKKSLHPSISRYLDQDLFSQFSLVNGNLNWNDYDLIFPIEDLYLGNI